MHFAGVYFRKEQTANRERLREILLHSVSDDGKHETFDYIDQNFIYVGQVISALRLFGISLETQDSVIGLAGNPIYCTTVESMPEALDSTAREIARTIQDDNEVLRHSYGTFAGVVYSKDKSRIKVFSDSFGVRPLYYLLREDVFAFSTDLKHLEDLGLDLGQMDDRGIAETAAFGFPLGDRTRWTNVRYAHAATVVSVDSATATHSRYREWERIEPNSMGFSEAVTELHTRFQRAVARRMSLSSVRAFAFLSGGMDSRLITLTLKNLGKDITAISLAPDDTLDGELAKQFADYHNLRLCHSSQLSPFIQAIERLPAVIADPNLKARYFCDFENVIWAGDGGSVGLGYVYLHPEFVETDVNLNAEMFAKEFMGKNNFSLASTIFNESSSDILSLPLRGITEEIDRLYNGDLYTAAYLFLMENDQRRHMGKHFRNISNCQIEQLLPFFDPELFEITLRVPVKQAYRHLLYDAVRKEYGSDFAAVAWQAYPGHVPSDLATPEKFDYQWKKRSWWQRRSKQIDVRAKSVQHWLLDELNPHLNRRNLCALSLLHALQIEDYSGHLRQATEFQESFEMMRRNAGVLH